MARRKKQDNQARSMELLPVVLTDSEKLLKGQLLASLLHRRSSAEEENKAAVGEWKLADKELEAEIRETARTLHAGVEEREVEVDIRSDWGRGIVEVYRLDTGELVSSREMTTAERQVTFFGAGPVEN